MVRLIGYSERGMVNAVNADLLNADNEQIQRFLEQLKFPLANASPSFAHIEEVILLVEQSFSKFGDADLIFLITHADGTKKCIFVEAKVHGDKRKGRQIEDRWRFFTNYIQGKLKKSRGSSALFSQLYRKNQLVRHLQDVDTPLTADSVSAHWKLGKNTVVRRAAKLIEPYVHNSWMVAMLPEGAESLDRFYRETLGPFSAEPPVTLPGWDVRRWGYITWKQIETHCRDNEEHYPATLAAFQWNREQVYCGWDSESTGCTDS